MRFEVRAGDAYWWDAAYGDPANRSEIADTTVIKDGTPINISYQFNLEPGAPNTAYWMALGQLHQDTDTNNAPWGPPFDIGMQGEKMTIDIKYTGTDGNPVSVRLFTDVANIQRGHYYDIQISTIIDPWGNGRLVVTRDGVTLTDYSGPLGYTSENGVSWKEGVYRANNATETIAADFRNLSITTGSAVTFPDKSAFVAAPVWSVNSVSKNTDGSRTVNLTGSAKVGSTVSIIENGLVVGVGKTDANGAFTVAVREATGGQHLLSAVAKDASGRTGLTSASLAVEIGTAADIVNRMPAIAAENVGAIVLTDTNVLTVTSATQMSTLINADKAAMAKIQGSYSFLLTTKVTGQPYDTQNTLYTSAGVLTERLRYAAGKMVYDQVIANDGSQVVKTINGLGGFDIATIASDGFVTSCARNAANGIPVFTQTFARDGSKSIQNFNAAGQQVNYTLTGADKSNVTVTLGITGQVYSIQAFGFDPSGKLILQERFTTTGLKLTSQQWNRDGSRETHNYSPTTGRETSFTIVYANGTSLQGQYGIAGKSYTASFSTYSSAGKLTGQTTSNALGSIPAAEAFLADALGGSGSSGPQTSLVYDPNTGLPISSTQTNADGSSLVTTYQSGSASVPATVKHYDTAGTLTETDSFNAAGQKVSVDITNPNGGDTLTLYNGATGIATGFTQTNADKSRIVTTFQTGSSGLPATVKYYGSNGTLNEVDTFNTSGQKASVDIVNPNGGDTLTLYNGATGMATGFTQTNADGSSIVGTYNPGANSLAGRMTYNAAGTRISSDVYNSDGSDVLTTFDPSSGLATQSVLTNTDSSRVVTIFQTGSSNLPATAKYYNAAGALIETDVFNSIGQKISTDTVSPNGGDLRTTFDGNSGLATGYTQTNTDGSSLVAVYATGSNQLASTLKYNPGGTLIETDLYDPTGTLISTEVYNADGTQTITYANGSGNGATETTQTNADGSRLVTTYRTGSSNTPSMVQHYDPNGILTETDLFDATGQQISADIFASNGSDVLTTLDPSSGMALGSTQTNPDGSRIVVTYQTGSSTVLATRQTYSATGRVTEIDNYNISGEQVSADLYADDGSHVLTTYASSGLAANAPQAIGNGFNALTSFAMGATVPLGAVTSISSFNAAGVLIAAQSWGSDGSHKVYAFDAKTGLENGYALSSADGSQTVATFAPGSEALLLTFARYGANGALLESDTFDSSGHKIGANLRFSDGSRSLVTYDALTGAVLQSTTYNADKTRTEVNNAIVGKPHAQQTAIYDATGKLISMVRTYGDANQTVAFTQTNYPDGSSEVHNYDTSGRDVLRIITASDGSRDTVTSTYTGTSTTPVTLVQSHFGKNNQLAWSDTTSADGSHKVVAAVAGASLTAHSGVADTFTSASAGSDTFVFKPGFGQDIVTNFHAGAGSGHDTIDLTAFHLQLGAGQNSIAALAQSLKQVNRDAVLSLNSSDTITFKNITVATLTKDDFLA